MQAIRDRGVYDFPGYEQEGVLRGPSPYATRRSFARIFAGMLLSVSVLVGLMQVDHKGLVQVDHKGLMQVDHKGLAQVDHEGLMHVDHKGLAQVDHKGLTDHLVL